MADPLYLSLWFPSFAEAEMMPRAVQVARQFPFSRQRPGITGVTVQPVSWNEASILERRFDPGITPEEAAAIAADLLHDDYAYVFESYWDLWTYAPEVGPSSGILEPWKNEAVKVKIIAQGEEFDEGAYQEQGHILVDFGLDTPFLEEEIELSEEGEERVKANVTKLVAFTAALEKNCGIRGRVLWSESDENLAQKLIARLQKVQ